MSYVGTSIKRIGNLGKIIVTIGLLKEFLSLSLEHLQYIIHLSVDYKAAATP